MVREPFPDALAERLPDAVNRIPGAGVEPERARVVAHVAPGADAVAEQMAFIVAAARVLVAVRAVDAHDQAPTFAGARRELSLPAGEQNAARDPDRDAVQRRPLHVQHEAEAVLGVLRDVGDAPLD